MIAGSSLVGASGVKGSSESIRMALLTFGLVGLQFTWRTEMTYCTPYLLQLGLTKSKLSLVWIAGPLSGLITQPIVGILADKSTSRWGRRRPVMVGGTILVSICLLILGWTREIVAMFISNEAVKYEVTIGLAVFSIYALDFSINAVQASCRSIIVDTLPVSKQQLGSAWASRMIAIGHLIGYGIGAFDLSLVFGTLIGDTQFKQLCVVAAISPIVAVGVTCWAVEERVLVLNDKTQNQKDGVISSITEIFKTAERLPGRIQTICWIQFWSWIGWFPFLFYGTAFLGEIYIKYDAPTEVKNSKDTLGDIGRLGSSAFVGFSVVTFSTSLLLPWFVRSPEDEQPNFTPRPPSSLAPIVDYISEHKPSLLTCWGLSHLIFTTSMIFAPFTTSLRHAKLLVAICGIPWALASWAPFAFIGIEINKLTTSTSRRKNLDTEYWYSHATIEMGTNPASPRQDAGDLPRGELSGVYLGILNLYTTLPQLVANGISTVVFMLLEPGKGSEPAKDAHPSEHHGTDGYNGIAVCLFVGALSSLGAAYATRRLKDIS